MNGKRVLLIDDEQDSIEFVTAILKTEGISSIFALNGVEGLDKARKEKPDLIILDIQMPKMDGFEVFDYIRNDKTMRHIPIIAVTASAMKGTKEEILAYGFDDYISKPIDEKLLKDAIRKVLNEG